MKNDAARFPGSARVSPSRAFLDLQPAGGSFRSHRRLPHFEKPWAIYAATIGTKSRRCLSPTARTIVLDALRHFHNKRYELFAACVMPDHVHFLIQPWPKENNNEGNIIFWPLSELIHSIKSFSAHEINKIENNKGAVWEMERFDRYLRSDRDLQEKFHYICRNPWDAAIVEENETYPWLWTQESSAGSPKTARESRALPIVSCAA